MEINPSRRARETSRDDSPLPTETKPDAQPGIRHAHETLLDGTARLYAQNATRATVNGGAPAFNDQILYVGMNSTVLHGIAQNTREEQNLGTYGVTTIKHGEDDASVGSGHIRAANGRVYDLTSDAGVRDFVATLGLPAQQASKVEDALKSNDADGRDELAGIAEVWARAEHGQTIPSRLVLSGHCYGTDVRDGAPKDGKLAFDSIQKLATAMPRAAAQVEDVMISACNSGHDDAGTHLSSWKGAFPNLKTAWGYSADDSHSPTDAHAVSHIAAWRAATAGRATHVDARNAVLAEYTREHQSPFAAENVATWTVADGYRKGH
jgi:hypothetical protein